MHANLFIHKLLGSVIHKSRVKLLGQVVSAIIQSKKLKLTTVGRALDLPIHERSGIRKIDRLLNNQFFQNKSETIYKAITQLVIGAKTKPVIIVDWTKLPNTPHYALRASLAAESRAITVYQEKHPKEKVGNGQVHRKFLERLKELLSADCRPTIVTDAGFKNPWFKSVEKLGWDFIGRVRGITKYDDGNGYQLCSDLHDLATSTPRSLGKKLLSRKNPLPVFFYIVKSKLKDRKRYNKNGTLSTNKDSKNYSRSYREPWVLVSSIKGHSAAKKVTAIYHRRMTIEEEFRDLKSTQYGFSMQENQTIKSERLIVWLMVASIASLFAWIVGQAAEKLNLHYQFQANSIRHRRVLSFFYLGCQMIRKKMKVSIKLHEINFVSEEFYI